MCEKCKVKMLRVMWYSTLVILWYMTFVLCLIKSPWWIATEGTFSVMGIVTLYINDKGRSKHGKNKHSCKDKK